MRQKLAILLWSLDPAQPDLCATPFVHAAVAAAMDCEVEVYFAGTAVKLLAPGVAAALYAGSQKDTSVYDHLRQARAHGAAFLACHDALEAQNVSRECLLPEIERIAGAAAFVGRVLDPEWSTLVF